MKLKSQSFYILPPLPINPIKNENVTMLLSQQKLKDLKFLACILFLLMTHFAALAQGVVDDYYYSNISLETIKDLKIKSLVEEYSCEWVKTDKEGLPILKKCEEKTTYTFDQQGQLIEVVYESLDAYSGTKNVYTTKLEYSNGKIIRAELYDKEEKENTSLTYAYHPSGVLAKEEEFREGQRNSVTTYNELGQKVEWSYISENCFGCSEEQKAKLKNRVTKYEYNDKNEVVAEIEIAGDGAPFTSGKFEYEYQGENRVQRVISGKTLMEILITDPNGNLIDSTYYGPDVKNDFKRVKRKYSENNLLVEEAYLSREEKIYYKKMITYDQNNIPVQEDIYTIDEDTNELFLAKVITYIYDSKNRLVEMKSLGKKYNDTVTTIFKYSLDANGLILRKDNRKSYEDFYENDFRRSIKYF